MCKSRGVHDTETSIRFSVFCLNISVQTTDLVLKYTVQTQYRERRLERSVIVCGKKEKKSVCNLDIVINQCLCTERASAKIMSIVL